MKIALAHITLRRNPKSSAVETLIAEYITRAERFHTTDAVAFLSESALFDSVGKLQSRTPTHLILLDPRGQLLTSQEFAHYLGRLRDTGTQRVLLAIGPADGWSADARARADLLLSFGPITLPHELARLVLAEQIYRAFTILAGHPYHSGH